MDDTFRLSPQQAHQSALGQRGVASVARLAIRLCGAVDRSVLDGVLQTIVARHEALRTTFPCLPGLLAPLQRIAPAGTVRWRSRDADDGHGTDVEVRLWQGPPEATDEAGLDVEWLPEGDAGGVLLIAVRALVADPASLDNVYGEIVQGLASQLPADGAGAAPLTAAAEVLQYVQYSEWQHELLASAEGESVRRHWQERLAALDAAPALPWQRTVAPGTAAPRRTAVPAAAVDLAALAELAAAHGAALAEALGAVWLLVLRRFAGGREPVIGWLVDGRGQQELETSIGCFAKRLPLRLPVEDDEPFTGFLRRLVEVHREGLDLADFCGLPPVPVGGRPLVWPFGFRCRAVPGAARVGGVSLAWLGAMSRIDRCHLELAADTAGRLDLWWDGAIHDPALVESLARALAAAVAGAAASDRRVGELPLLGAAERSHVLVGAAPAEVERGAPLPEGGFVARRVAAQARRTPAAQAVAGAGPALSFGQLQAAVERLAARLRELGVGPDTVVGLGVDRSALAVVGLLGILTSGGAWLALEASDPPERRLALLTDAGAGVLVLGGGAHDAPAGYAGSTLRIEESMEGPLAAAPAPVDDGLDADHLAYVIYTSGSTGRPKGVGVTHRGLDNYLRFVGRALARPGERWPWISRLSFDASLKQIFAPLLAGAPVWPLPEEVAGHPLGLVEALAGAGGDVALNCVPTLWAAILDGLEADAAQAPTHRLRRLLLGGERLTPELVARTRAVLPAVAIWNLYGPSETTANALVGRVDDAPAPHLAVPLGAPLDRCRAWVADFNLVPVPVGVAGEIVVSGPCLARGYLGQPDATAERFVPAPFGAVAGERCYRTGDLGRLLPDGRVEFVARLDDQVKVRGIRIELGEVEAALREHPEVRDAAVAVRQQPNGERDLAAYIVPRRPGQPPSAADLRQGLRQRLPDALVPAVFVGLDRLPLTASGKVDRRALPAPAAAVPSERPYTPPADATQAALAAIFAAVLGRERVGVDDDFFELGGHSIQSIRISYEANQRGLQVSPRDLFHNPTVAHLARFLAEREDAADEGAYEEGVL